MVMSEQPMDRSETTADDPQQVEEERHAEWMRAVEALIFAADEPIDAREMAAVLGEVSGEEAPEPTVIVALVEALNAHYEAQGRAFRVRRWSGGYRLSTTQAVAPYLKSHFERDRKKRLSRSLMETIAIVAYRQPVTKPEVDFVRGVDSDYTLRKLLELSLIDVIGRSDSVGRPLLYGTTDKFLDAFGLDTLEDLPTLREIEDLLADPMFSREKAKLLMLDDMEGAPEDTDVEEIVDEVTEEPPDGTTERS